MSGLGTSDRAPDTQPRCQRVSPCWSIAGLLLASAAMVSPAFSQMMPSGDVPAVRLPVAETAPAAPSANVLSSLLGLFGQGGPMLIPLSCLLVPAVLVRFRACHQSTSGPGDSTTVCAAADTSTG